MNDEQASQPSRHWLTCVISCLVLLCLLIVLTTRAPATRHAMVTIDTNGTVRLGGVLPMENKTVRDVALTAVGHLHGTASIKAAGSTSVSNLVEVFGALRKAGITSVVLRLESSSPVPRSEGKER